jgi:putative transcriptional regulator
MHHLAPGFIIAVPQLLDPNFRQSVVLLLEQGSEGAMGVIINRESPLLLRDLCRDHDIAYGAESDKYVRRGGPVRPDHGLVLFGREHDLPGAQPVIDGLQVSASRETLSRLCDMPHGRFHCYSGYAGWGPGQLEREISEGAWVISPADPALILDERPGRIWELSLRAIGIDPAALVAGGGGAA